MTARLGSVFSALLFCVIGPDITAAIGTDGPSIAAGLGVKHALVGSLTVAGKAGARSRRDTIDADLRVAVHIVDFAPDSRFAGDIVTHFSDVGSDQAESPRAIWEDKKCHRDRGLPKVTVTVIRGALSQGDARINVLAVMRHIGKRLPADEIIVTKRLTPPSSKGPVLATRAFTTASHLVFDLQLDTQQCRL